MTDRLNIREAEHPKPWEVYVAEIAELRAAYREAVEALQELQATSRQMYAVAKACAMGVRSKRHVCNALCRDARAEAAELEVERQRRVMDAARAKLDSPPGITFRELDRLNSEAWKILFDALRESAKEKEK